jgi:hypothetical protein
MLKRFLRVLASALLLPAVAVLVPGVTSLAASGSITSLSAAQGSPGTTVVVSGSGFTPSSLPTVLWNSLAISTSGSVNATGSLTASFIVPQYPRGTYVVSVTTSAGDTTLNQVQFTVIPQLTLVTTSGGVGDQVSITGYGFTASGSVQMYFDSVVQSTTNANPNGTISLVFTIPQSSRGTHTIMAMGIGGAGIESATAPFTITPKVTVTPAAASAGEPVTITGSGFAASQSVSVLFDENVLASTTADAFGAFTLSGFSFPGAPGGSHTVRVQDATGASVSIGVTSKRVLNITPASGPIATRVTVAGSGFAANQPLTITLDSVPVSSSLITDPKGTFSGTVDIPVSPGGAHQFAVSDGLSIEEKAFTVASTATSAPTTGFVGTKVSINGNGFLAATNINIQFDGATVKSLLSDPQGSFATTFEAPFKAAGTYKIRATDGANAKDIDFTITTTASINPVTSASSPGNVGTSLTISGVGFKTNSAVTATYDGKSISTGTVGADGKFTLTFLVPASKAGQHTITVSDGLSNVPFAFYMESTPPPAPALLGPPTGDRLKKDVPFTWNAATDPSGVTYSFQISDDQGFGPGSVLVDKTGLTTTQYTLTEAEQLKPSEKNKPYYWRVKATDGASNDGPWSNLRSFTVGTPFPAWAIWALVGLGAVIMLLFVFWLGRRTSASRPQGPARLNEQGEVK